MRDNIYLLIIMFLLVFIWAGFEDTTKQALLLKECYVMKNFYFKQTKNKNIFQKVPFTDLVKGDIFKIIADPASYDLTKDITYIIVDNDGNYNELH